MIGTDPPQKVFNRRALRLCRGAWLSENLLKLH